jgi:cell division protease FtsH
VAIGAERRSLILTEKEKELVAYHEAGHALVAIKMDEADPLEKVTIVPRGRSLGTTWYLPTDERYNRGRKYYEAKIAVAMGGRVAEEIVFQEVTPGAKGDIDSATNLALKMVCEWGMSERLGPIALGGPNEEVFLGREIVQKRHVSDETAEAIDEEVRGIVEAGRKSAHEILSGNRGVLDSLAMALLERETLDGDVAKLLAAGSPLPEVVSPPAVEANEESASRSPASSGESPGS